MIKKLFPIFNFLKQSIQYVLKLQRLPIMIVMAFITSIILGWLVYRERNLFINFKWEFRPLPLLFSFLFYTLALLLVGLVWSRVMNVLGGKVNFQKHFRFFCISNLGKRLPGSVWYIPWRGNMYLSMGVSPRLVSVASGIELAVAEISGAMVCLIFAIPMLVKFRAGLWIGIGLLVLSLTVIHPAVIQRIGRFLKVEFSRFSYTHILGWLCLNFFSWIAGGTLFFFVVNIFYPVPFARLGYVIGAWTMTGVLSSGLLLLPSNLGFTEISLSLLLSVIIPSPIAVVAAVGTRIILFLYELAWALSMMGLEYMQKQE